MSRSVRLDPVRYPGIRPIYTFKKWGAARALGVMDWVVASYGAEAAETLAGALRSMLTGQIAPREAANTLGSLLKAHGSAGAWEAFLDMAKEDERGAGLFREGASPGSMVPVMPATEAQQAAQVKLGIEPDSFFADEPLEAHMLILAMLCETFRPFGSAWASVAPLFGKATPTPAA